MSNRVLLRRLSLLSLQSTLSSSIRPVLHNSLSITPETSSPQFLFSNATNGLRCNVRHYSRDVFSLVLSPEGNPKFEMWKPEPLRTRKWLTKKEFLAKRKKKKEKKRENARRVPRKIRVKHTMGLKYATEEEKLKERLKRAKLKEAAILERLKKYEVPQAQGPIAKPHILTGEERFYFSKMAKKKRNYVPVGRRGIFGGVILNMHLHWKKHESVTVICKHCDRAKLEEYKKEIVRLSGGLPIKTIGDHSIVFYRGKDYEQPEVRWPIDTLTKNRALEKSKYEQSLEDVRDFIKLAEEEMKLYYGHVVHSDDPNKERGTTDRRRRAFPWTIKLK